MRDSPTLRTYLEKFIADRKALNEAKLLAMNDSSLDDASEAGLLLRSASSGSCSSEKFADGEDEKAKKAQLLQMLAFTLSAEQKRETEEAAEKKNQTKFKIKAVDRGGGGDSEGAGAAANEETDLLDKLSRVSTKLMSFLKHTLYSDFI
jgi:tRNA/tmRNA/rRNA uracil-C5-methylase (TrmA/RlmC/RlmD family)